MKIKREWLGGSEVLDLDHPGQWEEFWRGIVCDELVAIELRDRIAVETEVIVNDSEDVYIERYTRLDAPWYRDVNGQIIQGLQSETAARPEGAA